MQEFVYLYELDSVRKTDAEIIKGQKAINDEIVNHGNIVVLTYNQLVDSRGFFSLLTNNEYQQSHIRLFENGAIRISQFGDTRNLSQFLINSVDYDKKFVHSALPVKYSQKRILALIKRSLEYSDLSEIYEYAEGKVYSDEDLIELFREVDENNNVNESFLIRRKYKVSRADVLTEMRSILKKYTGFYQLC